MGIESSGHSQHNPRMYELFENAPKTGKSPTIWSFPGVVDWLKVSSQPVPGPWPPHQQPRPDPEDESLPIAVPESSARPAERAAPVDLTDSATPGEPPQAPPGPPSRTLSPESSLRQE